MLKFGVNLGWISDWLIACDNARHWNILSENLKLDYGISVEVEPRAPNYDKKIEYCRIMMRNINILDAKEQTKPKNLEGCTISKSDLNFYQKSWELKGKYVKNICNVGDFVKAPNP